MNLPFELNFIIFITFAVMFYCIDCVFQLVISRRSYQIVNAKNVEQKRISGVLGLLKPYLAALTGVLSETNVLRETYFNSKIRYQRLLQQAGSPGTLIAAEFTTLVTVFPALVFLVLFIFEMITGFKSLPVSLALFLLSLFWPQFWLKTQARNRLSIIQRSLPAAIDEITLIMKAGLGFEQSVDIYLGDSFADPLREEFYIMRSEIRLGKPRSEALVTMASRVGSDDVSVFTTTVIQSESTGVSITDTLSKQAEITRERHFQKIEEHGARAPLKMLFPMMIFVLPTIFLIIFAPMIVHYLSPK